MHNNIRIIYDENLRKCGFLKGIPLLKTLYNIKDFTFIAQVYYIAKDIINPLYEIEDFNINFHLFNNPDVDEILDNLNSICQIILQKQEDNVKSDITEYLLSYALEHEDFKLYLLTDNEDFRLRETNMTDRTDRSIIVNFNLNSADPYIGLLTDYLYDNNLGCLIKYLHYTRNLYFLKVAENFETIYGGFNKFSELFDFRSLKEKIDLNPKYKLWDFIELIQETLYPLKSMEDFSLRTYLGKMVNPFIEKDKGEIKNFLAQYLIGIRYEKELLEKHRGKTA